MSLLRYWPPLAHLALVAGFGSVIALHRQLPLPPAPRPDAATLPISPQAARPPVSVPTPLDHGERIEQVVARPLFVEGRRPDTQVPTPLAAPLRVATEIDGFSGIEVKGTLVSKGGSRALLGTSDGAGEAWVEVGDEVGGWRVEEILAGEIRLSRNGTDQMIRLFE
ncbi:hypothetical protein [uncultured Limimaricola sp.]|uniref:hypothetical protein n=1 Tax=uncultured Limimaricola sp. TaxID=2211667 RepID=UPI0030FA3E3D